MHSTKQYEFNIKVSAITSLLMPGGLLSSKTVDTNLGFARVITVQEEAHYGAISMTREDALARYTARGTTR